MKMPTVDKFFCFNLKTGGKLLGWIGVISGSLSTMLLTAAMIFTCSFSCEDLMKYKSFRDMLKELSVEDCPTLRFYLVFAILGFLIYTFIYGSLLRGIQTRDHRKILPAVYLYGLETLFAVSSELGSFSAVEIIEAVGTGAVMIYIIIAIYSLYLEVRDGNQGHEFVNIIDA